MCKIKPLPLKSSFYPYSTKFCTWKTNQEGLHLWTLSSTEFCLTGGNTSRRPEDRGAWDFSSSPPTPASGWPLRKTSKEPSQLLTLFFPGSGDLLLPPAASGLPSFTPSLHSLNVCTPCVSQHIHHEKCFARYTTSAYVHSLAYSHLSLSLCLCSL